MFQYFWNLIMTTNDTKNGKEIKFLHSRIFAIWILSTGTCTVLDQDLN